MNFYILLTAIMFNGQPMAFDHNPYPSQKACMEALMKSDSSAVPGLDIQGSCVPASQAAALFQRMTGELPKYASKSVPGYKPLPKKQNNL